MHGQAREKEFSEDVLMRVWLVLLGLLQHLMQMRGCLLSLGWFYLNRQRILSTDISKRKSFEGMYEVLIIVGFICVGVTIVRNGGGDGNT
jgi:hypothetical protein